MTLSVNHNINSTRNVAAVFSGTERVRADKKQPESNAIPQGQGIKASPQAMSLLDEQRKSSAFNTERFHQQAIDLYQSVQNEQRRSEVQSMLGVDLYA
ncbi:hypothetical protein QE250_09885 [Chromatiaceae bacterium AAb-1]|nr:hypothetical protein [Chromatiaceae bacterium AAb-1]